MNFIINELPDPLLENVERIACVWIGRLGDLIVATPALRSIRVRFPQAHIVLVVGEKGREIAELLPEAGEVLVLRSAAHPLQNLRVLSELRRPAQLFIDLNPSFSRASLALAAIANARTKLAFDKRTGRWAYTHLLKAPDETEHMLDRYQRLAGALKAAYDPTPRIQIRDEFRRKARNVLAPLVDSALGARKILIHPGNFKKFDNRWPEEKFVDLTNRLLDVKDVQVMYMAGPGEEKAVAGIVARLKRPVPVIAPLPVGTTAALLSFMNLLIVNATGTTHLAVAVGTPTFSLLSKYTKTVWMPRNGPHLSVVADSWTSCRDISVDAAWTALQSALK
jgi:ADP-heptose:LPS heptosyltransferase